MNKDLTSTVQVIAFAIERDTESLRDLLRKNGIDAAGMSKDDLQRVVTTALTDSVTFRREFTKWVMDRHGYTYTNATGPTTDFGMLGMGTNQSAASQIMQPIPPAAPVKSGLSVSTILDFVTNNFNTYASVMQSQTDKAVVQAAIERDRLAQATSSNGGSGSSQKSNTVLYVVLAIAALAGIGATIYYMNKKKS